MFIAKRVAISLFLTITLMVFVLRHVNLVTLAQNTQPWTDVSIHTLVLNGTDLVIQAKTSQHCSKVIFEAERDTNLTAVEGNYDILTGVWTGSFLNFFPNTTELEQAHINAIKCQLPDGKILVVPKRLILYRHYLTNNTETSITYYGDNKAMLTIYPGSLTENEFILSMQTYKWPGPPPTGVEFLAQDAYSFSIGNSHGPSKEDMSIKLCCYDDEHIVSVFAWDEGVKTWKKLESTKVSSTHEINAKTKLFTSFILGYEVTSPPPNKLIYLPLVISR